jgi:hypothetical protein
VEEFWVDRKKRGYFAGITVVGGALLIAGQPRAIGMFGMGGSTLVLSGGWTAVKRRRRSRQKPSE